MNDQPQRDIIGERLTELRRNKGWTQQELANLVKVERKTIIRYENAQSVPSGRALTRLASLFAVTSDFILGLSDNPHPTAVSDADLSPLEREAIQAFRTATTDDQRRRLLDTLKSLATSEVL